MQFNPFYSNDSYQETPLNIISKNSEKSHHILRTLSIDLHEARNVCFAPLMQTMSSNSLRKNSPFSDHDLDNNHHHHHQSNLIHLPKYHKDNLYYCLILFNNEAFVASTRLTTCLQHSQQSHHHHSTNFVSSPSFSSNLNSSSTSSNSSSSTTASNLHAKNHPRKSSKNANATTSRDSIWDDSFSFDNLPLDVKEIKICLFMIGKPPKLFSSSFVNNLKKIGSGNSLANGVNGGYFASNSSLFNNGLSSVNGNTHTSTSILHNTNNSKMLDPLLIGYVNIKLEDLMNKGLCERWYSLEPMVQTNSFVTTG